MVRVHLPLLGGADGDRDPACRGDLVLDLRGRPDGEDAVEPVPVPDPVELPQHLGMVGVVPVQAHPAVGRSGEARQLRPRRCRDAVDVQVLKGGEEGGGAGLVTWK